MPPWAAPTRDLPSKERTQSIYRQHQQNHQSHLSGSQGQRLPKKHGPFLKSFLSQHKGLERKGQPQRHSQQPAARQRGGTRPLDARSQAKPLLYHLLRANTSHVKQGLSPPHWMDRNRGHMCMVTVVPRSGVAGAS